MALTVAVTRTIIGKASALKGYKVVLADITFDDSYATGGEAIVAADLGLTSLELLIVNPAPGTTTYLPVWDSANAKIKVYNSAGDGDAFDEAASMDDVEAIGVFKAVAFGY
jgi:hypothetical protein